MTPKCPDCKRDQDACICSNELDQLRAENAILKRDSAAAWDKCEERRIENVSLVTQNKQLREAFAKYSRYLDLDGEFCCGMCGKHFDEEHHPNCVLAEAKKGK